MASVCPEENQEMHVIRLEERLQDARLRVQQLEAELIDIRRRSAKRRRTDPGSEDAETDEEYSYLCRHCGCEFQSGCKSIFDLPDEVFKTALSFIEAKDVASVSLVSKKLKATVHSFECESMLWPSLITKHHPILKQLTHILFSGSNEVVLQHIWYKGQRTVFTVSPRHAQRDLYLRHRYLSNHSNYTLRLQIQRQLPSAEICCSLQDLVFLVEFDRKGSSHSFLLRDPTSYIPSGSGRGFLYLKDTGLNALETGHSYSTKIHVVNKRTGKQGLLSCGILTLRFDSEWADLIIDSYDSNELGSLLLGFTNNVNSKKSPKFFTDSSKLLVSCLLAFKCSKNPVLHGMVLVFSEIILESSDRSVMSEAETLQMLHCVAEGTFEDA